MSTTAPASHELGAPLTGNPHVCEVCLRHPRETCPRCRSHLGAIRRLRTAGHDDATIAARLHITPERLHALDEYTEDAKEIDALRYSTVPVQQLQAMLARRRDHDPAFSFEEIARSSGIGEGHQLDRVVGLRDRGPRRQSNRRNTTIHCDDAGRIARALGALPAEVDS